jgi:hypothetical protein
MTNASPDRWHFDGRWYATTLASDVLTRDGIGLERDDVGPARLAEVLSSWHSAPTPPDD